MKKDIKDSNGKQEMDSGKKITLFKLGENRFYSVNQIKSLIYQDVEKRNEYVLKDHLNNVEQVSSTILNDLKKFLSSGIEYKYQLQLDSDCKKLLKEHFFCLHYYYTDVNLIDKINKPSIVFVDSKKLCDIPSSYNIQQFHYASWHNVEQVKEYLRRKGRKDSKELVVNEEETEEFVKKWSHVYNEFLVYKMRIKITNVTRKDKNLGVLLYEKTSLKDIKQLKWEKWNKFVMDKHILEETGELYYLISEYKLDFCQDENALEVIELPQYIKPEFPKKNKKRQAVETKSVVKAEITERTETTKKRKKTEKEGNVTKKQKSEMRMLMEEMRKQNTRIEQMCVKLEEKMNRMQEDINNMKNNTDPIVNNANINDFLNSAPTLIYDDFDFLPPAPVTNKLNNHIDN